MEGHLLGGLAGQDGAGPDLLRGRRQRRRLLSGWSGGGGHCLEQGGREGAGFTRDYDGDGKDTYVNALRATTLWGAAKFR